MDGNGRWAKNKMLPRLVGHNRGLQSAKKIIECCIKYNIDTLTLYAFSTENWKRPLKEVDGLLKLFSETISKESKKIHSNKIKLKFIGDTSILTEPLQLKIKEIEKETSRNKRLILNVALNYGGRHDIVNSVNSFYENKKNIKKITEKNINNCLYTKGQHDVDLLIRTGGQQRMSNFLLWQSAYAELYFSKKLWPDFDEKVFVNALYFFQNTERKFGSISN
ncbi:di-trans,poly-cis-decaprenylcistransferase [Methylophilales bacterium]|nr:di-trans,poly-cis-decaprenylcistransferase [Methylophilales bacterium]